LFSGTVFAQAPAETPAPPVNAPPVLADAPPAAAPAAPPAAVVAAPPAAAPAAPAAPAVPLWYSILRFEALVDSYYQYNFTGSTTDPNNVLTGRTFDVTSNSFSLNFAKVAMQLDVSPVTLRIDLGYGHTGFVINSLNSRGASGLPMSAGASLYGSAFLVEQAYSSLALGPVTLDFGKFVTTAGAEVNEANKNWMYSRSLLFYTIPILHTGARATFKASDQLTLQASLVNGINNDPDNNGWKTVGLSATVTPVSTTSIIVTDYFGKEGAQGTEGDVKNTLDVVISQTINDKLTLNLNVDYVKLGSNYLVGGALMGHYVLSDSLNFSARAEYVKDKNGTFVSTLADTNYYEGSVVAAAPFAGHLEIRAEVRADFCKDKVFVDGKDNQVTGTVAFLSYL
jgi:hypothetical protein